MYLLNITTVLAALLVSVTAGPVSARTNDALTLQQQLQLAGTAVDRQKLLKDADFVFDFNTTTLQGAITQGAGILLFHHLCILI
jgi:hypothetical protein